MLGELLLGAKCLAADGAGKPVREVDGVNVAALGGVVGEGHVTVRALGHQRHLVVHRLDVLQQESTVTISRERERERALSLANYLT